jgi:hypothetical protein
MVEKSETAETAASDDDAPGYDVTITCATEAEADAAETAARHAIAALRSRTCAIAARLLADETRRAGAHASAAARGAGCHEYAPGRQFGNGSASKFHG